MAYKSLTFLSAMRFRRVSSDRLRQIKVQPERRAMTTTPTTLPPDHMPKTKKRGGFYAVALGRKPGVYSTWRECQPHIHGVQCRYEKFSTRQEAEEYVRSAGIASPLNTEPDDRTGWEVVYVDGACSNNQDKEFAQAGAGVWWADGDPRNVSERCPGAQTNNRGELLAIIRVLETASNQPGSKLLILTDSFYSINCTGNWLPKWIKASPDPDQWKSADGRRVKNARMVYYAVKLLHRRQKLCGENSIKICHVLGHSDDKGNDRADELAVVGAQEEAISDDLDWNAMRFQIEEEIERDMKQSSYHQKLGKRRVQNP
ncbi:ribonuclease H-like domain-containing protein [Auriculariales sp. MPI-PUGE-AT-0066]|nr:ribonuclease H-like domain-containing protein [Auriculariales sp. MPI-PUGE-AT-0066]